MIGSGLDPDWVNEVSDALRPGCEDVLANLESEDLQGVRDAIVEIASRIEGSLAASKRRAAASQDPVLRQDERDWQRRAGGFKAILQSHLRRLKRELAEVHAQANGHHQELRDAVRRHLEARTSEDDWTYVDEDLWEAAGLQWD